MVVFEIKRKRKKSIIFRNTWWGGAGVSAFMQYESLFPIKSGFEKLVSTNTYVHIKITCCEKCKK